MKGQTKLAAAPRGAVLGQRAVTDEASAFGSPRLLATALVCLTVFAYLPAFSDAFIWDDDAYIQKNATLQSPHALARIWGQPTATPQYYPLVFTTFWIEYHLWGSNPAGYHVVNVLLHALNAVLLWSVLRGLKLPGAWLAAAIFAVHPIEVESVAWVTERKNTLSALLYLSAMLAFFRFNPPMSVASFRRGHWGWYAAALVLFCGALFSKTVTCSLPAAILLILWWKRGRLTWRDLVPLVPFFAIGAGLAYVTVWMEKHHVLAEGVDWRLTPVERCLIAGRALWFYAAKLAWPHPLIFMYPRWQIDARSAAAYLFPLSAVAVIALLWVQRRRWGRGPLAAVLLFAGTLLPALGFFDVYPMRYSFVADHFQYLAGIALIVPAAWLAATAWERWHLSGKRVVVAAAALAIATLTLLTWRQCQVYADLETLWIDTIAKNPGCWMAHHNLGLVYFEQRRYPDAIAELQRGLAIRPSGIGHYHVAQALVAEHKPAEAVEEYRQAIRLQPEVKDAHQNLAVLLASTGNLDEAADEFLEALRIDPTMADTRRNLQILCRQAAASGRADLLDKIRREENRLPPPNSTR